MSKKNPLNIDQLIVALLLALLAFFGTMATVFALGFTIGSRL